MLAEYCAHSQVTLPKPIADSLGLSVGDMLDVTERDGGVFMVPFLILPKKMSDYSPKSEKEKRELLHSLYGSIDDPTLTEPK